MYILNIYIHYTVLFLFLSNKTFFNLIFPKITFSMIVRVYIDRRVKDPVARLQVPLRGLILSNILKKT